jgi:hypothetical protein
MHWFPRVAPVSCHAVANTFVTLATTRFTKDTQGYLRPTSRRLSPIASERRSTGDCAAASARADLTHDSRSVGPSHSKTKAADRAAALPTASPHSPQLTETHRHSPHFTRPSARREVPNSHPDPSSPSGSELDRAFVTPRAPFRKREWAGDRSY